MRTVHSVRLPLNNPYDIPDNWNNIGNHYEANQNFWETLFWDTHNTTPYHVHPQTPDIPAPDTNRPPICTNLISIDSTININYGPYCPTCSELVNHYNDLFEFYDGDDNEP